MVPNITTPHQGLGTSMKMYDKVQSAITHDEDMRIHLQCYKREMRMNNTFEQYQGTIAKIGDNDDIDK